MANLTPANVQLFPGQTSLSESEFFPARARTLVMRRIKIISGTAGGTTNLMTAAAFGLTKLVGCTSLYDAQNAKVYRAAVDPSANVIYVGAVASDTPADITTNAGYITVWGY